jgi:hypothetical protein
MQVSESHRQHDCVASIALQTTTSGMLANRGEVQDLEIVGAGVTQIDEAALCEGLPLHKPLPIDEAW